MRTLAQLTVKNFKSIRDQTLRLGKLNVFVGGNGCGKSNLIGVFRFLNRVVSGELQTHTAVSGGANAILHFGRKRSPLMEIAVEFQEGDHENGYSIQFLPNATDRFLFAKEEIWYRDGSKYPKRHKPFDEQLGAGHGESRLASSPTRIAGHVLSDLFNYRIYHFHDTSPEARIKQTQPLENKTTLFADAANLAPFLRGMRETSPGHFQNIEGAVRQVVPFFAGFHLEPDESGKHLLLAWREKGHEEPFPAAALSDGTLRFMCLATLLLQPNPPAVILLDEPELGLHPAAIHLLAALLESASTRSQVLVATQSVTLLNQLTPEDVWTVERRSGESVFKRLKDEDRSTWPTGVALGDLWERNVFGGTP
ncbi:MAG: AAA family ATPase [Verrucomicrobia bacterium]|nr:AAA family ATPase [Verrucomicrobiota bacterium]